MWLVHLATALPLSACSARPTERPAIADTAGAERERNTCSAPRKASRLYVGLSEGMTLDDFELAAYEAERIAAALLLLCEPGAQTADSDLRTAFAGALEITAIEFVRDDAGAARVRLQRPEPPRTEGSAEPDLRGAAQESWRLEVTRTPAGWLLRSAARE